MDSTIIIGMLNSKDLVSLVFCLVKDEQHHKIEMYTSQMTAADWDALLRFSTNQGISPILYDRINLLHYNSLLPANFVACLRENFLNNAARNLYANKQINEILAAFDENQIPVILLKGIQFLITVYKNPACRTMADLDLLIYQEHTPQVLKIFKALGYNMDRSQWEGPEHHLPALSQHGSPLPVEIHWELTSPNKALPLPTRLLWETAQPRMFSGHKWLELSPAITLFHICQHAAYQHLFSFAPRALFDNDEFIRSCADQIDWTQFWRLVETSKCVNGIALVLKLTKEWLATPLPDFVSEKISEVNIPADVIENAIECMFLGQEQPDTPPPGLKNGARWWLAKIRKFISEANRIKQVQRVEQPSSKVHSLGSINRLIYLVKDNIKAAINQVKINPNEKKIKTNRSLRGWLNNP